MKRQDLGSDFWEHKVSKRRTRMAMWNGCDHSHARSQLNLRLKLDHQDFGVKKLGYLHWAPELSQFPKPSIGLMDSFDHILQKSLWWFNVQLVSKQPIVEIAGPLMITSAQPCATNVGASSVRGLCGLKRQVAGAHAVTKGFTQLGVLLRGDQHILKSLETYLKLDLRLDEDIDMLISNFKSIGFSMKYIDISMHHCYLKLLSSSPKAKFWPCPHQASS